jgi:hypothetical protein
MAGKGMPSGFANVPSLNAFAFIFDHRFFAARMSEAAFAKASAALLEIGPSKL